MISVKGYYDGTSYVAVEDVNPYKNQNVIITLLDEPLAKTEKISMEKLESFASASERIEDAQTLVKKMREDRGI